MDYTGCLICKWWKALLLYNPPFPHWTLCTVLAVLFWDLSKAVKTLLILLSFFFLKKSHYGQPYLRPMSTIRQIVTLFLLSEELLQELIYYKE